MGRAFGTLLGVRRFVFHPNRLALRKPERGGEDGDEPPRVDPSQPEALKSAPAFAFKPCVCRRAALTLAQSHRCRARQNCAKPLPLLASWHAGGVGALRPALRRGDLDQHRDGAESTHLAGTGVLRSRAAMACRGGGSKGARVDCRRCDAPRSGAQTLRAD